MAVSLMGGLLLFFLAFRLPASSLSSASCTTAVREALPTVVMSLLSADRGADLHRVHDVRELRDALTLREATMEA